MSSAEVAAKVVKSLEPDDYKLLKVLASGLKQHESLTRKEIMTYSKMHENIVDFRINRLHDMKLIGKNKGGFTLLMMGLDTVALKMLVDKDIIIGMGKPIGIGKESDVFEAITSSEQERALKFFRIGRISFREVRRRRTFIGKEDNSLVTGQYRCSQERIQCSESIRHTGIRIQCYITVRCIALS